MGTQVANFDDEDNKDYWSNWSGLVGPPVPVIINNSSWEVLVEAAISTLNPTNKPRVFRLFMERGDPRYVVSVSEIKDVWKNNRGVIRWKEGEYPNLSSPLRKGGNAFIKGDIRFKFTDAWWMGREQTDLRILLTRQYGMIVISAWWCRAGSFGLAGKHETDGEIWPVKLLINPDIR